MTRVCWLNFGLVQDTCLIFGGSFRGGLFHLLLVQAFSRRIALSREFNRKQTFAKGLGLKADR